ncbi:PilZ domain-containing protein [Alginatibacterium sediminis]|uniref:Cyclic diguanosine monophosphate-binding protein n=1 Tax=Alginatibacterium sediminis TaxID=2164068 RepID=A0A420E8H8_9ALTE|nr:PilZ domain-containing protein [Alginatibacterium sediminis]RKF15725.1 PilZ domain-containing protein [Alginatibacterium sediminis]
MDERRNFLRIIFERPAQIRHGNTTWTTSLHDLSLRGALVNEPNDWDSELKLVTLSFLLDEDSEQPLNIVMDTKVKHQRDGLLGLECHHIDIESITELKRLIELNLGNDDLLHRELEQLVGN